MDFLFRRRSDEMKDRVRQKWAREEERQKEGRPQRPNENKRRNISEKALSDFAYLSGSPMETSPRPTSMKRAANSFAEVNEESAAAARERRARLLGLSPTTSVVQHTTSAPQKATPDPARPRSSSRSVPVDLASEEEDLGMGASVRAPGTNTLSRPAAGSRALSTAAGMPLQPAAAPPDTLPVSAEEEDAWRRRRAEELRRDAVRTLGPKARAIFGLDGDADGPTEEAEPADGVAGYRGRARGGEEADPRFKVRPPRRAGEAGRACQRPRRRGSGAAEMPRGDWRLIQY